MFKTGQNIAALPGENPGTIHVTPLVCQGCGKCSKGTVSSGLDKSVCGGPGAEVTEQLIECPARLHAKGEWRYFHEGKRDRAVALFHKLAFGRPIGPDCVLVEFQRELIHRVAFHFDDSVGPYGDNSVLNQ